MHQTEIQFRIKAEVNITTEQKQSDPSKLLSDRIGDMFTCINKSQSQHC